MQRSKQCIAAAVAAATAVGLFGWAAPVAAQKEMEFDPYAASTKICESVVNDSILEEFPKAKGISWDMDSVSAVEAKRGVDLAGAGTYRGETGNNRTFEFACSYDTEDHRVTSAWWTSSFDRKQHVVVEDEQEAPGVPEADVDEACRRAVLKVVRAEFPSSVRSLELINDSIERSISDSLHELVGEARFQGGGGTWRRCSFTCSYDAEEGKVTEATWRHLGAEENLD